MTDVFVYDHVRTPRGKGKADGSLHEVTAVELAATALRAIKARNGPRHRPPGRRRHPRLRRSGRRGRRRHRPRRRPQGGYGDEVPGIQINRFCASGLDAVNFAAAQVMAGQHDMVIGGGVESMSRVGMGAARAAPGRSTRPSPSRAISCRRASRPI
jgi:acetyl-CoA C-acetyltransferase